MSETQIFVGTTGMEWLRFNFVAKTRFHWYAYFPEKISNFIYLSIDQKHGNTKLLIKCGISHCTYILYNGTKQIFYTHDRSAVIRHLNTLYDNE